ncbi:MAG: hypothetical protein ACK5V3_00880 [Bdellovibrionales bacterium]
MKSFLMGLFCLLFCFSSQAQTLDSAIKQELSYINLQYDSLQNQRNQLRAKFKKQEIYGVEKMKATGLRLAQLQTEVDELQHQVTQLERNRKSLTERSTNLVELYNKVQVELLKTETELNFQLWKPSTFVSQTDVNLNQFNQIIDKLDSLLKRASQSAYQHSQYFDESGILVQGEILRLGRAGALVVGGDSYKILGPSPEGILRTYQSRSQPSDKGWSALLFQDLNARVNLKVQVNLWDKLADLLPGFVLFLIFSLVLGLFTYMARE